MKSPQSEQLPIEPIATDSSIANPAPVTESIAHVSEAAMLPMGPVADETYLQKSKEDDQRRPSKIARVAASIVTVVGMGFVTMGASSSEGNSNENPKPAAEASASAKSATEKPTKKTSETVKKLKDSLSPPPVIVSADDPVEFAKQSFSNFFNGVSAGTLNGVYEKYIQAYAQNPNGDIANTLRQNAIAFGALRSSYGKQNCEKLVSVEVDPLSVDFQPTLRRETITQVYSLTQTDSSIGQTGSDITEVYKETDNMVWVQKKVSGKMSWVVTDESTIVNKELVSRTVVPHEAYKK